MMYHMKNIVVHDDNIVLPKCMYRVKARTDFQQEDDINLNISNQVIKFLKGSNKMTELEHRQDELLQKLDTLYERIKTISSHCNVQARIAVEKTVVTTSSIPTPEEVVIVVSPESLPWYIHTVLKQSSLSINISWHIHSSVPNEAVPKIKSFVKMLPGFQKHTKINIRLIFKCVSADTELKLSSLATPIVGNVNILRYLSNVYPNVVPYDSNNHQVDYLLDVCHTLERTSEKNKEPLVNNLCSQSGDWLYGNTFSIVDLAAYNAVKQWKNVPKYVPKAWFTKCEKQFL